MATEHSTGMTWEIEPDLGGRWQSLRGPAGREWLAQHPSLQADRRRVRPGDPYVDLGGLEECFPTIAGAFDHGNVWDRPWIKAPEGWLTVAGDDFELARRISTTDPGGLVAEYRLRSTPGLRFVWAGHASIAVGEDARLVAPVGHRTRLWREHWRTWPDLDVREGSWPAPDGVELDRLGRDGTANFLMLLGLPDLTVRDGDAEITFALDAPGQPLAMAIWRNLGAWPPEAPYRSVAIEPAIGWHFDRDQAGVGEVGVVPGGGEATWSLTISATA